MNSDAVRQILDAGGLEPISAAAAFKATAQWVTAALDPNQLAGQLDRERRKEVAFAMRQALLPLVEGYRHAGIYAREGLPILLDLAAPGRTLADHASAGAGDLVAALAVVAALGEEVRSAEEEHTRLQELEDEATDLMNRLEELRRRNRLLEAAEDSLPRLRTEVESFEREAGIREVGQLEEHVRNAAEAFIARLGATSEALDSRCRLALQALAERAAELDQRRAAAEIAEHELLELSNRLADAEIRLERASRQSRQLRRQLEADRTLQRELGAIDGGEPLDESARLLTEAEIALERARETRQAAANDDLRIRSFAVG
jgi:hypothetical protein